MIRGPFDGGPQAPTQSSNERQGRRSLPGSPLGRRALLALLTAPTVTACGLASMGRGAVENQPAIGKLGAARTEVVIPGTDLAVGPNRFSLAVLQFPGGPTAPVRVSEAELKLTFYFPIAPQPIAKGQATPTFVYVDEKTKGLFVADTQFDQPGNWGVEVTGTAAGKPFETVRTQFVVKPKSDTPAIGAPAPRSKSLTRFDVDDIKKIDSGVQPNDMHELSIAQALDEKKPLVVLFASPGFCVTQTCAPELGEVQKLKAKRGGQANFIHIEIYKDPMTRAPFETVKEWGLTSEPWVFMVDRAGLIAAKFEGPAPFAELDTALQKLV